jgi:tRNA(Ile)-lysidine synthase
VSALLESIERTIVERRLLRRGQEALVAVSGGVDSMVLLHALHQLAPRNGWNLVVAHFNHRLRGRASDADATFVRKAAQKLGLSFVGGAGDVNAESRKRRVSIEMAARELRLGFLIRAAAARRIRAVALAHHQDDQVELFFLRWLRGAGGGLAGMRFSNPAPGAPKIRLIRPLLGFNKSAIRRFARVRGIPYREDRSNTDTAILRNRVRLKLVPFLQKQFGKPALDAIPRVMEILGAESEFCVDSARKWLASRRGPKFRGLPVAVQRQCLRLQLLAGSVDADFSMIESLRENPNECVSIGPARTVCQDGFGRVRFCEAIANTLERFGGAARRIALKGSKGRTRLGGRKVAWRLLSTRGSFVRPARVSGIERFDAGRVGDIVTLRHWRNGDRFQPIGMKSSAKLQDLFVNLKVPRAERHRRLVATDSAGALFWVEGLRISERHKLTPATRRVLEWKWS